jgi:hypothetical protein
MSKTLIGLIFILAGVCYGSLAIDDIYNHTLGYLMEHEWVKPPVLGKKSFPIVLGRKPTIILYSLALIIIGLFLIWNRNN